jgi:hypothetical protein
MLMVAAPAFLTPGAVPVPPKQFPLIFIVAVELECIPAPAAFEPLPPVVFPVKFRTPEPLTIRAALVVFIPDDASPVKLPVRFKVPDPVNWITYA